MFSQSNSLLLLKSISRRHFLQNPLRFSTTSHLTRLTKKTCIDCLKNCKSMKELMQIQTQVVRIGLHQNQDTINKLMVFCTDPSLGNLHYHYAERIHNFIENPSLFMYNVLIKAYAKSGSFKKALLFFHELRIHGMWPDNFTYPFVFKAFGYLKDVLEGEKVHGFVVKSGVEFDCYVCNSLMDVYAELGYVDILKLFDEMPERDLVSCNVLISGCVRCKRFEDAVKAFRRMQQETHLKPKEATIASTVQH